jgi:outer membrane lipoprotein carrier protein
MRRRRIFRFCDFVISRFREWASLRISITQSRDHTIIRVLALLLLLYCGTCSVAADSSLQQLTKRVDARYNHMTTLKANFQENYNGAGVTRNESGELWLQKPGKMRWQYEQPTPKLFIVDGKNAFFYVPAENQARRMPAKKLDDFRSPIRYLLGHTKLQNEFNKLAISSTPAKQTGDVVLEGIPKGMEDRLERVLLEITPADQIGRIRIEELDGSATEFIFEDIQENVVVKAGMFRFTPPPGVEVIEGQDVEP